MSDPLVKLTVENGVARLELNRPQKRNALTREAIVEMTAAVEQLARDESVRLLILSAAGSVFCAGMDLGEMQQRASEADSANEWKRDTRVYRDLLVALFSLNVPTLAVVQGPALAGGLGLVLACDIVLAADSAFFALPEPKRGITAAVVAPLLSYRIGAGQAGYLLLSGKNLAAGDARRMGVCHEVAPLDQLADRERELVESILSGAPQALARTKKHLHDCAAGQLTAQLDAGMTVSAEARQTDDAREGLAAFLEKRAPRWSPDGG